MVRAVAGGWLVGSTPCELQVILQLSMLLSSYSRIAAMPHSTAAVLLFSPGVLNSLCSPVQNKFKRIEVFSVSGCINVSWPGDINVKISPGLEIMDFDINESSTQN